ncbi:substrate-binding domain-containing protein [Vibrio mangrovi]|uniref:Ribose operon repressor n=1 Tax=Vibrio mangrovi TaxID=474394 RepID=A0A1Y6IWQ1_9VIBR|nr:substrate-binding domain-containing protein [Vibrio mangrovi]MDW6005474.1 substrate-binding domain-containing protein [Vibrio mangrovi]SMS02084.1 Ribose operon repressor [Vibrio mangrovi]
MATMKDIAKRAGVSTSTVSHVINKTRYVSDEIAARVNQAAKDLNYAPSALARSLKMNRTKTLGMLVTTSTNPFFGEVVKGVERSCYQKGYNLILCNTEGDGHRMKESINTLLEKRVDGLILMCAALEGEHIDAFDRFPDIPVVVMDRGPVHFACDKIQDNSLLGGFMATNYLIECGHRDIGCITGPLKLHQAYMRYEGFKKAMTDAKLPINPAWIAEANFECDGGADALQRICQRGKLPSAIFVGNDMMAMGVVNEAHTRGIRIPQDLSIIGYDDIYIAKYVTPSLTTIHQPKHRLGTAAVEALVNRLEKQTADPQVVHLEPTLVIRDSVISLLNQPE